MAIDSVTIALFDRIAKMEAMGVANGDIVKATGLSPGRISQVQDQTEYKEMLAEANAENLERNLMINQGWDAVEETALATVVTHLNEAPDAEFALKAAAMANKAQRRNSGNRTLTPGNGQFVVINLNANFIEKVNETFTIEQSGNYENSAGSSEQKQLPQKDSNFLPPNAVEELLGAAKSKESLIEIELEAGLNDILQPALL